MRHQLYIFITTETIVTGSLIIGPPVICLFIQKNLYKILVLFKNYTILRNKHTVTKTIPLKGQKLISLEVELSPSRVLFFNQGWAYSRKKYTYGGYNFCIPALAQCSRIQAIYDSVHA